MYIESQPVLGDGAGEGNLNKCTPLARQFVENPSAPEVKKPAKAPWKILIVDDDPDSIAFPLCISGIVGIGIDCLLFALLLRHVPSGATN